MKPKNDLVNAGEGIELAVPLAWRRSGFVIFSSGEEGDDGASIVVRRETIDPRLSLTSYMDSLLVELARTLPDFAFIERRSLILGGQPAMELLYTVTARGASYEQRQVCTLDPPGSVLSIVMSAMRDQAESARPLWAEVLKSAVLTSRGQPK